MIIYLDKLQVSDKLHPKHTINQPTNQSISRGPFNLVGSFSRWESREWGGTEIIRKSTWPEEEEEEEEGKEEVREENLTNHAVKNGEFWVKLYF